jgi:tRNA (adenine37-N6)-methyltransferase
MEGSVTFTPIGVARTPFSDRLSAPRQPFAARDVEGTIELFPGHDFEHALSDLDGWEYLWVIFCFHLNQGWRPKVLPPRSAGKRRGVFSTRSPHRPNPIGMSAVRLVSVTGLSIRVRDVDMLDGSPVLDIKPYVPYADAYPGARTGWLAPLTPLTPAAVPEEADAARPIGEATPRDPEPGFEVVWSNLASAQAAWLRDNHGVDLTAPVSAVLALGPQPHPYRRIKREGAGFRLAVKDWRARFRVDGRRVTVESLGVGYRPAELATSEAPAVAIQRAFAAHFGA